MTTAPSTVGTPAQAAVHDRVRELLTAAGRALLAEQPSLQGFEDARPERDRPSGESAQGAPTLVHVSALLAARRAPDPSPAAADALVRAVDVVARRRRSGPGTSRTRHGIRHVVWGFEDGDRLELVLGVRVALRVISAPFLPSPEEAAPTSPATLLSPRAPSR